MDESKEQKKGAVYTALGFLIWGTFPIYFKSLQSVGPLETLCHRIIWTVPFTALLLSLNKEWPYLKRAVKTGGVLITLFATSILIAVSWGVFIYAVTTGRVLECSIGYFMNPLVMVLMGTVLLREKLRPMQKAAIVLAGTGTFILTIGYGSLPWISLVLSLSFCLYGFLRKTVRIESTPGLFVETVLLSPPAILYMLYLMYGHKQAIGTAGTQITLLLLAAGIVNSMPLLLFTSGARRIQYTTVGLLQYIVPTSHFLLAVFAYGERFTGIHALTFAFIWSGLAIFIVDTLRIQRSLHLAGRSG